MRASSAQAGRACGAEPPHLSARRLREPVHAKARLLAATREEAPLGDACGAAAGRACQVAGATALVPLPRASAAAMNVYINILQVLVPLYLVILLGYAAGECRRASALLWHCRSCSAAHRLAAAACARQGLHTGICRAAQVVGAPWFRHAHTRRQAPARAPQRSVLSLALADRLPAQAGSRWRTTSYWTGSTRLTLKCGAAHAAHSADVRKVTSAAPQFALPGLLYRNIATTDLYSADWSIVGASITFKVRPQRRASACSPRECHFGAPSALTARARRCLRAWRCSHMRTSPAPSKARDARNRVPLGPSGEAGDSSAAQCRACGGALACHAQHSDLSQLHRHRPAGASRSTSSAAAA